MRQKQLVRVETMRNVAFDDQKRPGKPLAAEWSNDKVSPTREYRDPTFSQVAYSIADITARRKRRAIIHQMMVDGTLTTPNII